MTSALVISPTYHVELIDGREIEKPLPKKLHTFIQVFLIMRLGAIVYSGFRIASELNVLCGADRLAPDVMIVRRGAKYDDGDLQDPPALAVEILSPGQTIGALFDKAARLIGAGAPSCWVIWPERRKVWIYSGDDLLEASDNLTARLAENETLTISLKDLWASLDDD